MQHRSMSFGMSKSSNSSFWGNSNSSAALAYQNSRPGNSANANDEEAVPLLTQVWGLQDSMISQLQGFAQSLPEAGPLSESFRIRLTQAIYLLLGAAVFGVLTVVIGLPTILVRPSKFVLCMTLTTGLAAGSVIVLQKPSVFFAKLMSGACSESGPFLLLVLSELVTVYVTIFVHKYVLILACAGLQLLALLYYLSCFIPGGAAGLQLILRMSFTIVSTLAQPLIAVVMACVRSLFS